MSDLNTSFTFRLTHEDKAALADLAGPGPGDVPRPPDGQHGDQPS